MHDFTKYIDFPAAIVCLPSRPTCSCACSHNSRTPSLPMGVSCPSLNVPKTSAQKACMSWS